MKSALQTLAAACLMALALTGCPRQEKNAMNIEQYKACRAAGMRASTDIEGDVVCQPPVLQP